jgi:hypothetical protein
MTLELPLLATILTVCVTGLIAWAVYWDFRKKRLQFDERRVMIENGINPPPPAAPALSG